MAKNQKFRVEEWVHYSRLGRRRKKLLKYRKARGRDNKVRLKMKGHLRNVDIGFGKERSKRGLIDGKKPVIVYNLKNLSRLKEKGIGIIGKIGDKKRIEIAEHCLKNKIKVLNLNPEKFLAKIEEQKKKKMEEKAKLQKKSKEKEKKTIKEDKKEKIEENIETKVNDVKENAEEKK
jgi:ribosomal protein L32E